MRFFIASHFSRAPEGDGLRVTGTIFLEVREAGKSLCQRTFDVDFHSNSPDLGEESSQSIVVRDGAATILSEEGMLDEHHEPALFPEMRLAYGLFMNQIVQYLQKEKAAQLSWDLDEDDFSLPVRDFLFRLCRGTLNA